MGGKAFAQRLSPQSFPRIPTPVYETVKARLIARLQKLYRRVGVPHEAPEKTDHGDLDFLVVGSLAGVDSKVRLEDVQNALGATLSICLEGNRTSNFAIPVDKADWEVSEDDANGSVIYYQVDVHVCADDDEWERIYFYHSYGDLGMILGLLARNNRLALGTKGLRLLDPPNPPFDLCTSFPQIISFLGLSFDTWETQGFSTKRQIFEWVATSKVFDPKSFKVEGEGIHKVKRDRKMYAEFISWVGVLREQKEDGCEEFDKQERGNLQEEALEYFNKKKEFEDLARSRVVHKQLKIVFNSQKVGAWMGLSQHWQTIKLVMQGMKERLGGDEGVLKCWEEKGEEELQRIALAVKDELDATEHLTKRFGQVDIVESK